MVDMRKILHGIRREEIRHRMNEVPYRLMTFVPGCNKENMEIFLKDLARTAPMAQR